MKTIPARARAAGPVLHSRMCATVTAASCAAHLWLAAENRHGPWLGVLMLAMVAVCVPCSLHIWRHPRASAVHKVMASALAMAVLHAFLLLSAGSAGHSHGTSARAAAGSETSVAEASLAVIALEIATALLAATLLARLRRRGVVAGR
ncbi:hypothetical protein [Pseudarthrobacter albicanus]|uniref:hypothetical protein n=1 Tax=Pseudarthrobacter albicanus TaxID=2823873 RepID=UPI0035592ED0